MSASLPHQTYKLDLMLVGHFIQSRFQPFGQLLGEERVGARTPHAVAGLPGLQHLQSEVVLFQAGGSGCRFPRALGLVPWWRHGGAFTAVPFFYGGCLCCASWRSRPWSGRSCTIWMTGGETDGLLRHQGLLFVLANLLGDSVEDAAVGREHQVEALVQVKVVADVIRVPLSRKAQRGATIAPVPRHVGHVLDWVQLWWLVSVYPTTEMKTLFVNVIALIVHYCGLIMLCLIS